MDELIHKFIKTYLTIELQDLISESYVLFEKFDYKDVEDSLINIIVSEDFTDPGELKDIFLKEFNSKIDYVINQNGISLKEDTDIYSKVEIMKSLYQLQHLEDYNILYNIISSQEDDDETKLSSVLAQCCLLDVNTIMELITNLQPTLIIRLREYIEMKLSKEHQETCSDDVMVNIQTFFKYLKSKNRTCLGTQIVSSRAQLGLEFNYYFPFVEDDILSIDDNQTALNFLSILMISSDGQNKILDIYRQYIGKLIESINQTQKIEKLLMSNYESFMEFKREHSL